MKPRHDKAAYYRFLKAAYEHFASHPSFDSGLVGDGGMYRLRKAYYCGYNPLLSVRPTGEDRECGRCLVCRGLHIGRVLEGVRRGMLSPVVHAHYSVSLSLPKWPEGLEGIRGWRSVGELFYVTPALFVQSERDGLGLNKVLSGLRKEAVAAVGDCFPGMRLGMFVGLHLSDDWMQFSPHVHLVLCGTMLDEGVWPLEQASDGSFPGLGGAWRRGIGGRRGLSCRAFRKALQGFWAARFASYAVETFLRYRRVFVAGLETDNLTYRYLGGMSEGEIRAMEEPLRDAVLGDRACVHVKEILRNYRTDEEDPEQAMNDALTYDMDPPMKRVEFRDLGNGMVTARFEKKGEWHSCGKTVVLFRRVMQMASVAKLRSYERYGFYSPLACGGKVRRMALLKAMNEGYPRGKA